MVLGKEMSPAVFTRELCKLILVGVGGIALLCGFFSLFLAAAAQVALLPFITGFNGAVSGYNLAEKSGVFSAYWKSYSIISLFFCIAGVIALLFFAPPLMAEEWQEIVLSFAVFSLFTSFGGLYSGRWIARKARENSSQESVKAQQQE
ncbi:MAG: hypothetical protein CSB28_02185 [Desulfobacterales bacterium]|nr:MAG: hypothetical protein CSB28_02185 [Desulfobacterales bacterium]